MNRATYNQKSQIRNKLNFQGYTGHHQNKLYLRYMSHNPSHTIYTYDGTFEGLLTVVFEAFDRKQDLMSIEQKGRGVPDMFAQTLDVETDEKKADRVWQGLVNKTGMRNAHMVYVAFLSELPDVPMLLWRYLKKVFTSTHTHCWQNLLDEDVHRMVQTARKVKREAHLFQGLVRFQKTADGMFFALIEPDHNILWLLSHHFKSRYATQPWVIYDTRRMVGIWYDLKEVQEVQIENPAADFRTGKLHEQARDMDEDHFTRLWKAYYRSITINERANPRQMTRMMPRRYWKYLPEKGEET